ncbi:hypothetical protein ACJIZ3_006499 [Penstemon smallii]|uniref:ATP-dependent DNA helicase n=1 Tax=Penstemon smallii TaxID=265156 RepID=A0ABD3S7V9_9LAMI
MRRRYVNAMALVQKFGKPDLFITMTCNLGWKEIRDNLLPSEVPHDRPDLIARVFKAKLEELKDEIVRKKIFGDVAAYVYAVEYQKRGLPHVHWVIILTAEHKIISADVYDNIISAEIPDDTHPLLRSYVLRHMMHGPCGEANPSNVCMQDGICKNHYPKTFSENTIHGQGTYPSYKRRDDGRSVRVRNVSLDNRWVIPHCPRLLAKFDCHINVEICSDIKLVKYLYKYIYKGHDKAAYHVVADGSDDTYDEIQAYQAARYICAPEALWRIFGFPMSEIYPPVIVLPVHLPNHQPLRFGLEPTLEQLLKNPLSSKTMLTEFFWMNSHDPDASRMKLLYRNFPEFFVWNGTIKKWSLRKKKTVVGRLSTVSPFEGERYFERLLLMHMKGPISFDHLRTIASGQVGTFREAAVFRGLLESDDYADNCLAEATFYQMPCSLRKLYALLLVYVICARPQVLWDKYYTSMSEDFSRTNLVNTTEVLRKTITAVDNFLVSMDRSLSEFSLHFPIPFSSVRDKISKEYEFERNMPVSEADRMSANLLNTHQKIAYQKVISRITSGRGGVFFVDGPGGTGKTFLYRSLLAFVRSRNNIALAVATSGVAASLLPGGRTAHSRFKLPFNSEDKSVGSVSKQSSLAKMIVAAELIVWDEATMANRYSIDASDKMLQDLCECRSLFGGKVVLFGGDFRQTLPIVVRGGREAMISASIVSSTIWPSVIKLRLHENMRAREDPSFVSYLMRVGNGEEPVLFDDYISIPQTLYIPFVSVQESLNRLIDHVFPSLGSYSTDPYSLINRAILTPKNDCVEEINDMLIDKYPGVLREYVSFNSTVDSLQQGEYEDYLNGVSVSGLPPHLLKLKLNSPIMLLRNLNPVEGLCNGTRLICKELGDNFIGAEIAVGEFKGCFYTAYSARIYG